jgi:FixJ family two-component response regulator
MSDNDKQVAIVDDDEYVRDGLVELLDSVGYKTQIFIHAKEFLETFDPLTVGCILLDVRMPGMSGIELQHKLNEMDIRIPIIIMTGHGDIAMAVQAMKDGAFEFIQKPFRDQDVIDAITKALEKNALDREVLDKKEKIQQQIDLLTKREREVVNYVLEGMANKVIAKQLGVSDRTVEIHRSHAMQKLGVKSVAELVKMMMHKA